MAKRTQASRDEKKKAQISGRVDQRLLHSLETKIAFGRSKHADKKADARAEKSGTDRVTSEHIYSISTHKNYKKIVTRFSSWVRKNYGDYPTDDEVRHYAREYIQMRNSSGLSSYTIKAEAAALAKALDCTSEEFGATKSRLRADIKRGRGGEYGKENARHFSEERNRDLVDFCLGTGLRRAGLSRLKGTDYDAETGIITVKEKGGKTRSFPVDPTYRAHIEKMCTRAGEGKVFKKIPSNANIHGYRAKFASAMYDRLVEGIDISLLDRKQLYYCRGDRKGEVFVRDAMQAVSIALGHNRISVIASHYLR